jgi:methylmalonyl-CoA mutase cobalamin-binding subunit
MFGLIVQDGKVKYAAPITDIFQFAGFTVIRNGAGAGKDQIISDMTSGNSSVIAVEALPEGFCGDKYLYTNGQVVLNENFEA